MDNAEWNSVDIILSSIVTLGSLAQVVFVLRSLPILQLEPYHEFETLDNEMAFSDTDDVHIVSLSGLDIVFAVLGGLLWLALVIIGARSFGAMFSISLNQPLSIVQAVMILSAILGSVPSLVYNLRVWNKKGIAM
ncbi:MAG: hypothetical protein ACOVQ5_10185 [Flavobacteriales bacterium]|jgi:hypothetical protein